MAFMRFATAVVTQPHVTQKGWGKVRKTAAAPSRNLVSQASEILGKPFNPDDYLLTHCTIVASVDVDPVPNVKLGRVKIGSKTINRKYSDYHIQPKSSQFVNNNGDSWSREVLLMSYPTFIGSHNFLEHVQIEEQSKGRIIDAVARDIGDSIYIDILVATDRRHSQLVQDIESGKIASLSMGCSVEETICSKCGNVAVDETELCEHIKYEKLNSFIDDQGKKRVIAELCGHPSLGGTGGVTFIEASWVGSPAFTGAVMRNILEPSDMSEATARRVEAVLNTPPPQWDASARQVTAQAKTAQWGDEADPGMDEAAPEEGAAPEGPADKSKLDQLVEEVYETVADRVKEKAEQEIRKTQVSEALNPEDSTAAQNSNVLLEATRRVARVATRRAYVGAVTAMVRTASSDIAFLDGLVTLNESFGVQVPREVYRTALKVGALTKYASVEEFLGACRNASRKVLSPADARSLIRLGKLLARWESTNPSVEGDRDHGRT